MAPENGGFQVRNLLFKGAPIFRGENVSFREGTIHGLVPGNSQKSSCNFPLGNCKKIATDAFGTPHKKTIPQETGIGMLMIFPGC